jgi:regulator of nonsense transcripts 2
MDVEFMLSDSLEVTKVASVPDTSSMTFALQAVRPKLVRYKTIEEAALAVDEMFNLAFQSSGSTFCIIEN